MVPGINRKQEQYGTDKLGRKMAQDKTLFKILNSGLQETSGKAMLKQVTSALFVWSSPHLSHIYVFV